MGTPPPEASKFSNPTDPARRAVVTDRGSDAVAVLVHELESRGYAVTRTETSADMWSAIGAAPTHLVVVDLVSPLSDESLDLFTRLREEASPPRPLVLAVTPDREAATIVRVLDSGADDVLPSTADTGMCSIRLDVLDARIRERLHTHRTRLDLGSTTHELGRRQRELAALHRIAELSLRTASLEEAYAGILAEVSRVMELPGVVLERLDRTKERLVTSSVYGLPAEADIPGQSSVHKTAAGAAVRTSKPVVARDGDARVLLDGSEWSALQPRAWASFPLNGADGALGALTLVDWRPRALDEGWIRLGEKMATTVAVFVERLESEAALRESESRHRTAATELKQANQELEAFAYSVSHDLRAPLRTIQGFAHSLVRDFPDRLPVDAVDYARRIVASGGQLERLLTDLLEYSRLSFEELALKRVELGTVVEQATEQVKGDLNDSRAELEVEDPLPAALGSQTALVQVVANLLSNAVKFVPLDRRPQVRIRSEESEDHVRLWVEDNGIGIPAGQEERIFRVFERLGQTGDGDSTGIGLAIVRRGMQRIGGECGVLNLPEEGSAFWIDVRRDRRQTERSGRRRPYT